MIGKIFSEWEAIEVYTAEFAPFRFSYAQIQRSYHNTLKFAAKKLKKANKY